MSATATVWRKLRLSTAEKAKKRPVALTAIGPVRVQLPAPRLPARTSLTLPLPGLVRTIVTVPSTSTFTASIVPPSSVMATSRLGVAIGAVAALPRRSMRCTPPKPPARTQRPSEEMSSTMAAVRSSGPTLVIGATRGAACAGVPATARSDATVATAPSTANAPR